MNREIKFRVWHPFYGMMEPQDIFKMTSFRYDNGDGSKTLEKYYEPDVTFLQFTGLKDSKGKEIYEGDIFEVAGNRKYIVKYFTESENNFEKAYSCFCLTIPERMTFPIDEWAMGNGKVIGNIYENPDLLTPNP